MWSPTFVKAAALLLYILLISSVSECVYASSTGTAPVQVAIAATDYVCGSGGNWSMQYTLRTLGGADWSPTLAVYGDMGTANAVSLPWLVEEVASGGFDAVLHVGDLAYDLFQCLYVHMGPEVQGRENWFLPLQEGGKVGDKFMEQVEPIATQVPYMVAPGNHEWLHNFTHYKNRFSMPGNSENYHYSWNIGPAHIISFSTEVYFFLEDGLKLIEWQYHWLEQELQRVSAAEYRGERPWIIAMGHRPMYCSTNNDNDCDHHNSVVRVGLPLEYKYGLEKLFYQYGVDLELWGHEHIYERMWPLFNYTVMNGSYENPYTNPGAPVHIVTGSAGCREDHGDFKKDQPEWVAFTSRDYGYSKMTVHNATHLSFQQISADQGGKVVDEFTIIKDYHGPYRAMDL
ncbi:Acid phosphatase type 7 [Geodia barretti]|uniref:Acid phosphatase type 7 n=1 Tax=Geodia barretti TaxID=519541 RepID=A0AA35TKI4_GEOBA|nr:Acid phosphatase type 7 [Geodia barretti]